MSDTMRCGPTCTSTCAITVSRTTRVTMPTSLLRADALTTGLSSAGSSAARSAMNRASSAPSTTARPESSLVVLKRPASAHRRTVSSLTWRSAATSLIRSCVMPGGYGSVVEARVGFGDRGVEVVARGDVADLHELDRVLGEIGNTGDLEPHDVGGVVGDPLRVGLGKAHADLAGGMESFGHE